MQYKQSCADTISRQSRENTRLTPCNSPKCLVQVLVIGGFGEQKDPVDTVETLDSKISFDVLGDITIE